MTLSRLLSPLRVYFPKHAGVIVMETTTCRYYGDEIKQYVYITLQGIWHIANIQCSLKFKQDVLYFWRIFYPRHVKKASCKETVAVWNLRVKSCWERDLTKLGHQVMDSNSPYFLHPAQPGTGCVLFWLYKGLYKGTLAFDMGGSLQKQVISFFSLLCAVFTECVQSGPWSFPSHPYNLLVPRVQVLLPHLALGHLAAHWTIFAGFIFLLGHVWKHPSIHQAHSSSPLHLLPTLSTPHVLCLSHIF